MCAPAAGAAPEPTAIGATPPRTSMSFAHSPTGFRVGTANEHESRPGLSLVKLYIADYVFDHGTPADQARAYTMLQTSDDAIAASLYAAYPDSIALTARKYGLGDTHAADHWGNSTTSTYDAVAFLEARKRDHGLGDPILSALASASPVAADGYRQDYGTAVLPGVIGTKWGWSDDRASLHASASFGTDFSVAAHTFGPASQLTADVIAAFPGPAQAAPSPIHQAIDAAASGAHSAVDNAAGAWGGVPGSSESAAGAAAQAHSGIDAAAAQAHGIALRAGF
nr:hypothetical protein [Corynebacterium liangguodongii]